MYLLPIYTVYKTYYNLGRDSISWNPADFVKTSVIPPVQRNISIRKQFRDFYNLVNNLVSIFFYVGCQKFKPTLVVGFNFCPKHPNRMRQSVNDMQVSFENEVFVGEAHRHAWRIREYTIRKILKNRLGRIFLILIIVYRGAKLGLPE